MATKPEQKPHHRARRRSRRPAPLHRLRHRAQAPLHRGRRRAGARGAARRAWRSTRSRAGSTRTCTASRKWTMRQYAGYATRAGDERALPLPDRARLDRPVDGLRPARPSSAATPTTRCCEGEVGRTGVAIDSIDDMRRVFDGIPLDKVSTSMTINAPAAVLLLLYELVGEEQGVESKQLRGTTQNDILKEYIARGNFIYPPVPAMRLTTDLFAYCRENVPKWNTISISGYHIREKGCSAVQEVGVHARERDRLRPGGDRRRARGRRVRPAAGLLLQRPQQRLPGGGEVPRRPADVGAHHARALRRARTRSRRRCASTPRPAASRWPPSSRRTTSSAWRSRASPPSAAARSRCTRTASTRRSRCPTETRGANRAAHAADRRARVGRGRHRRPVRRLLLHRGADRRDRGARPGADRPGSTRSAARSTCIAFIKGEIEESAWGYEERYRSGQDIVVGVNEYVDRRARDDVDILRVDPASERQQVERLKKFKADRDQRARGEQARGAARGRPRAREPARPIRAALKDRATIGEVCGAMRDEFGEYQEA